MPQIKNKRTVELMLILCMAWMFYSLDGSVISVLITNENFNKTFNINPDRLGLFGLFPAVGALISVLGVGGLINRRFGRRRSFQIATLLVIIGVILQTFPDNWPTVLAGRIIMGIGGDLNGLVLGYYVTEISPKAVRGRALILVQQFASSFINIAGTWIAYGISYLPQDKSYSWKVANSLQFVPGVIFILLTFKLPESPRWLARKYSTDDTPMIAALASIRALPVDHPDVVDEAKEIRDYDNWHLLHSSVTPWNVFTQKRLFKRVFHAFIPFLGIQLGGVGLLTIYAAIIYQALGLNTQRNALLLTSCLQVLYAACALGSAFVVEKLGRRPCIVWGQLANTVGLALITALSIGFKDHPNQIANGWIGPTTVYINEILPSQARELGVGMAQVFPIAIGVALGQKWPLASAKLGPKSYIILLATSAFGFALNWWFVVEPKGLSIEHIDHVRAEYQEKDSSAFPDGTDSKFQVSHSEDQPTVHVISPKHD